jgi:hypothetical protein
MKIWQEFKRRLKTISTRLPLLSSSQRQISKRRQDKEQNFIFQNKIILTRRVFLIRGYQAFLQLYLFLDNSSY